MKTFRFRALLLALAFAGASMSSHAADTLKIGVLTDMQGPFSSYTGNGSFVAAQMAVEDFQATESSLSYPVEVITADHQNKPDVGSGIARKWLNEGVDAIVDVPNSAVALAVNFLLRDTETAFLSSGGSHDSLTGTECSPNTINWTFDTYSLGRSSANLTVEQGGDSWFFITSDFAGGHSLERISTQFGEAAGAKIIGSIRMPLNTADYSSAVLQAQASKANVVVFAMGGEDIVNALKQANEFGLAENGTRMTALSVRLHDAHAIGLEAGQGLVMTQAFYWDMDDEKRDFARRFAERNGGSYPSDVQAGVYASTLHYLKAVSASKTHSAPEVISKMKELPTDDPLFGNGRVRSDGRVIHDMFVVEIKKPSESKGQWDYFKVLQTVPGDEAFRPEAPDECSLVKG